MSNNPRRKNKPSNNVAYIHIIRNPDAIQEKYCFIYPSSFCKSPFWGMFFYRIFVILNFDFRTFRFRAKHVQEWKGRKTSAHAPAVAANIPEKAVTLMAESGTVREAQPGRATPRGEIRGRRHLNSGPMDGTAAREKNGAKSWKETGKRYPASILLILYKIINPLHI